MIQIKQTDKGIEVDIDIQQKICYSCWEEMVKDLKVRRLTNQGVYLREDNRLLKVRL